MAMKYSEVKLACSIVLNVNNEGTDTFLTSNGWEITRSEDGLDIYLRHQGKSRQGAHIVDEHYDVPWTLVQWAVRLEEKAGPGPVITPTVKR